MKHAMDPEEYPLMYEVEDHHWWYRNFRAVIHRHWRRYVPLGKPHLLDAGCGTGAVLQVMSPFCVPTGIDFSPLALSLCRKRELVRLAAASAADLPLAGDAFDVAFSFDVLCNRSLPDKQRPLDEIYRVLRPGGLLFLNLPAYQWLRSSHDVHVHTDTRFVKRDVVRLLRQSGFRIRRATYWNTLLFPATVAVRLWRRFHPSGASDLDDKPSPTLNTILCAILLLERALMRLAPLPFGLSIFVVAQKAKD